MLAPEFLARFGLFIAPGFIERETCERLCAEIVAAGGARATVTVDLSEDRLDEDFRRTTIAQISAASSALMADRLLAFAPALEQHFSVALDGCEPPQFLLYREGDFIGRHSDGAHEAQAPEWLKRRALSAVVFLNDHSDEAPAAGSFSGGALTFYGLLAADPRGGAIGLPLRGTAGLLVVFRTDLVHEVASVVRGERCTAVSWYKARGGED
ncbi:MAG: 2OG-Fe(II) oxygenase [Solirubrobacteraceae bacterium]